MSNVIRVGILGMGNVGRIHHFVASQMDNFEVVCVADPQMDSVPVEHVFDDYRDLLRECSHDLDAVINALPTAFHLGSVEDTVRYGLPMLLEKPMGIDSGEAEQIQNIAEEYCVKVMVGMTGRYHPEFMFAHKFLSEIGEIMHVDERIHFGSANFPQQYVTRELFGHGVGLTNGVHTIDRFLWFTGQPITSMRIDHVGNELLHGDVEDSLRGKVTFRDGVPGWFSLRYSPHTESDYVFEIVGTEGMIRVKGFDNAVLIQGDTVTELYEHNPDMGFDQRHFPGIEAELNTFATFLQGNERTKHVDDCIRAQRVIGVFYKNGPNFSRS